MLLELLEHHSELFNGIVLALLYTRDVCSLRAIGALSCASLRLHTAVMTCPEWQHRCKMRPVMKDLSNRRWMFAIYKTFMCDYSISMTYICNKPVAYAINNDGAFPYKLHIYKKGCELMYMSCKDVIIRNARYFWTSFETRHRCAKWVQDMCDDFDSLVTYYSYKFMDVRSGSDHSN
jgi:hypothetical protein